MPSTYENGKRKCTLFASFPKESRAELPTHSFLLADSASQEAAYGHDKFCLSSQIRYTTTRRLYVLAGKWLILCLFPSLARSISNSSSNNSSMSTVRNATGQVGPTSGVKSSSSPPPPAPSHLHYHHYYHNHQQSAGSSGQTLGSRQNYPNLSNSPTSLGGSPNSPGALHQHQSSASSSSSSSHPASAAPHHYHQQPTQGASQLQEMAATTSPSSSLGGIVAPNVRHHHDEGQCEAHGNASQPYASARQKCKLTARMPSAAARDQAVCTVQYQIGSNTASLPLLQTVIPTKRRTDYWEVNEMRTAVTTMRKYVHT